MYNFLFGMERHKVSTEGISITLTSSTQLTTPWGGIMQCIHPVIPLYVTIPPRFALFLPGVIAMATVSHSGVSMEFLACLSGRIPHPNPFDLE